MAIFELLDLREIDPGGLAGESEDSELVAIANGGEAVVGFSLQLDVVIVQDYPDIVEDLNLFIRSLKLADL